MYLDIKFVCKSILMSSGGKRSRLYEVLVVTLRTLVSIMTLDDTCLKKKEEVLK